MKTMEVRRETWIEDLVRGVPGSVTYLRDKGIRCLACGEPIWGSLEEAARAKGYSDEEINAFVRDLDRMARPEERTRD